MTFVVSWAEMLRVSTASMTPSRFVHTPLPATLLSGEQSMTAVPSLMSDIAREQLEGQQKGFGRQNVARVRTKYLSELGEAVCALLDDPDVTDLWKNPHSDALWVKTHSRGVMKTQIRFTNEQSERFAGTIAGAYRSEVSDSKPRFQKAIPFHGARFSYMQDPIGVGPGWVIRKRSLKVHSLDDLECQGVLSSEFKARVKRYIHERLNLFIIGPQGVGKTTMINAVIQEMVDQARREKRHERFGIIEDAPELQCTADDRYEWLTNTELGIGFNELLHDSLRFGATRLCIGELRSSASTFHEAMCTGYGGSITSIHGSTKEEGLRRYEIQLRRDGFPIERDEIRQGVNRCSNAVALSQQPNRARGRTHHRRNIRRLHLGEPLSP